RILRGQTAAAAAAAVDAAPLTGAPGLNRMLLLYIPNGVHIPAWYPETEGADYAMSRTLAPLEAYRDDFSILNNLACLPATLDTAGDHAKAMGCFLTNVQIRKTATDNIQAGISMDQVIANKIGQRTRFPSLELG